MSYGEKRSFGESKVIPVVVIVVILVVIGFLAYPSLTSSHTSTSPPSAEQAQ